MIIKLNTNNPRTTIYDRDNLIHATGDEVINLDMVSCSNAKRSIINIISSSLGLNANEELMYMVLCEYLFNKEYVSYNDIIKALSKDTNMSITTFKRAGEKLLIKGVIRYVNGYDNITINECYKVNIDNNNKDNNIKYIVINVNN